MGSETAKFREGRYPLLLSAEQIQQKVHELGERISADYQGLCPVFIGVLNGSYIFLADLMRHIDIDCEVDFVKISSYGDALRTSGVVKVRKEIDCHIEGRDVLVVEDIIDSGLSVTYLERRLTELEPKSLKFASLLVKEGSAQVKYRCEYIGFRIPNRFVVGYGLDYAQQFRNLPAIYVLE